MPRSLSKDIDLETMYSMRREGMNNVQIADALGVSRQTVIRYIGPQPKELNDYSRPRGPRGPRMKAVSVVEEAPPACLVVDARTISLTGMYGKYELDIKDGRIDIINGTGQEMRVNKDMLGDFINELSAIKRKMEVLTFENEAW